MDTERRRPTEAEIDEAELESFPASDPHALHVEASAPDRASTTASSAEDECRVHEIARSTKRGCLSIGSVRFWLLTILLGGATTVAFAWVIAFWPIRTGGGTGLSVRIADTGRTGRGWRLLVRRHNSFGLVAVAAYFGDDLESGPFPQSLFQEIVPTWSQGELLNWANTHPQPWAVRTILITGWPAPSLWASVDRRTVRGDLWPPDMASISSREPILPLRIEFGGFTISTLFWTAVWAVLLLGPVTMRRAWRRSRGRCVSCGYERRGLTDQAACPECGARRARIGMA